MLWYFSCVPQTFKPWEYYYGFCTLGKVAIPTIMTMRLHTWEGLWIIWCTCSTPPTPLLPFPRPPKSASDICQYTIGLTGKTSPRSFQSYTIPIFINQDYGPLLLTGLFDLWRIGKRLVLKLARCYGGNHVGLKWDCRERPFAEFFGQGECL